MKDLLVVVLMFVFMSTIPTLYIRNIWLLANCDFKPSYKGEVIHAVGVFTPTFLISGWVSYDE